MLAVVVMFDVELIALNTLPLRLNPAAFKLPATTLLEALSVVAEITLAPVMLPLAPEVEILPAITLPVALTVVALTLAACTLPVALTVVPLILALYGHPDAGGFWELHLEKSHVSRI